ncbi:hypothetical protein CNR22_05610 [Sphingobacteriaceae bacterium]|nr:hypothetical protein CNR22_05610 [Sphingobacteriaceae bacterium]
MENQLKNLKGQYKPGYRTSKISMGLAVIFTVASLSFSSCRKKDKEETIAEDTEQSTATDNNVAESYVADIESMGSQVSDNGSLSTYKTSGPSSVEALEASGCAAVTVNNQVVTIDFGTSGCIGKDGRTRTGKLIYDFSGSASGATRYRNPGFNMSVTSQNYVVDGYAVTIISKSVSNITSSSIPSTANPGTNLKWSVVANISIVKPNSGGTISWSCNRTKELMNTGDTLCYKGQAMPIDWTKAMVKINGSASGVNAKGENFTANATNLVRDFNCAPDPVSRPHRHPFISGTIAYTPGSRPLRTIDFGNGACDMAATVTINGRVFNITLP